MTASSPTRIDEDVTSAAKVAAEVFSRSTAQQVNHWARIGRELEASTSISQRDIAEVLAGRASYDELSAREQAVVRADWSERMTALREGLDLAAEFAAAGESWTEADAAGAPVERSGAAARPRRRRRTA
jgi:hypothetical protein